MAAADVVWILIDPGLHHLLVDRRGWSHETFRDWIASQLVRELSAKSGPAKAAADEGSASSPRCYPPVRPCAAWIRATDFGVADAERWA